MSDAPTLPADARRLPPVPDLPAGTTIGHFRLAQVLGRGAGGTVYLAEDVEIPSRRVALKLMRRDGLTADLDALRQEASMLASLQHPHILVVHEIGTSPQGIYLVTEHMPGGSVGARLRSGACSMDEALRMARAAADALGAAHDAGIVHRDIKPENLLLDSEGRPKLGDFGLAWAPQSGGAAVAAGTPGYIDPDLFKGQPPSAASDQYSFGVVLRELMASLRPSADINGIIARCVDQDRTRRHASMKEVTAALDAAIARRSPERRGHQRRYAVLAGIILTGAAIWFGLASYRSRRALALNEAGRAAMERGDLQAAREAFLASLRTDPSYLPACANLGALAGRESNPTWAVTILKECAETFPGSAAVLYNLGATMRVVGDAAGAEEQLVAARALAAGSGLEPVVINELAMVMIARGRPGPAGALAAEAALTREGTTEGAILLKTAGLAMLAEGKHRTAGEQLERALQWPLPVTLRAVALEALGRSREALSDPGGAMEAYSLALLSSPDEEIEQAARSGLERVAGAQAMPMEPQR